MLHNRYLERYTNTSTPHSNSSNFPLLLPRVHEFLSQPTNQLLTSAAPHNGAISQLPGVNCG